MLRAAQLLERDAEELKKSHTRADGTWGTAPEDEVAQRDCTERQEIAVKLKVIARASR